MGLQLVAAAAVDDDGEGAMLGEDNLQAADEGVNVVAQIDAKECNLIEYISPGRKFSFIFHD